MAVAYNLPIQVPWYWVWMSALEMWVGGYMMESLGMSPITKFHGFIYWYTDTKYNLIGLLYISHTIFRASFL